MPFLSPQQIQQMQVNAHAQGLADAQAGGMGAAMPDVQREGLADQSMINALYDIFGSYPRANVLPYFYSFQLTTQQGDALAANDTGRASIKVSADAAFVAKYITGTSTGPYLDLMRTDSSDRQLMGQAVHSAAMVGTAERPMILPKPLLLAPNTTISFDLTNLTGAVNDVYLTLVGFKVYKRQYAAAG